VRGTVERLWPRRLPKPLVYGAVNLKRLSRVIGKRQFDLFAEYFDGVISPNHRYPPIKSTSVQPELEDRTFTNPGIKRFAVASQEHFRHGAD
jgi:hypothetical protein